MHPFFIRFITYYVSRFSQLIQWTFIQGYSIVCLLSPFGSSSLHSFRFPVGCLEFLILIIFIPSLRSDGSAGIQVLDHGILITSSLVITSNFTSIHITPILEITILNISNDFKSADAINFTYLKKETCWNNICHFLQLATSLVSLSITTSL